MVAERWRSTVEAHRDELDVRAPAEPDGAAPVLLEVEHEPPQLLPGARVEQRRHPVRHVVRLHLDLAAQVAVDGA